MAATTTKTEAPKPDLFKALLAALKAEGVKATPKWSPAKKYASLLVGGKNVGYVFAPGTKGMRIEPRASKSDLRKGSKLFKPGTRSAAFALVGVVSDDAGVKEAATVLKIAAEKQAAVTAQGAKASRKAGKPARKPALVARPLRPRSTPPGRSARPRFEGGQGLGGTSIPRYARRAAVHALF